MPRKRRICLSNITYHIYSRCHNLENMIKHDLMKDMLNEVINMAMDKYNFQMVLHSIMDTHFHFIIKTVEGGESISRIMQFIKSQFAQRYNRMMNRKGAFWNERFGDTIIEFSDDPVFYFLFLQWYIAYNSVRANKVNDPRDYKYCSINSYLDENYKPPVKITFHDFFLNLGNTFKDRARKFLEYEDIFREKLSLDLL